MEKAARVAIIYLMLIGKWNLRRPENTLMVW
jgi:hypothetical protein